MGKPEMVNGRLQVKHPQREHSMSLEARLPVVGFKVRDWLRREYPDVMDQHGRWGKYMPLTDGERLTRVYCMCGFEANKTAVVSSLHLVDGTAHRQHLAWHLANAMWAEWEAARDAE